MNTDDARINQAWKQLYETAVLELDPIKRQQRIADAENAIAKCALAVMREGGDDRAEREALANAMQVLSDLKRNLNEGRNRGSEPGKKNIGDPKA